MYSKDKLLGSIVNSLVYLRAMSDATYEEYKQEAPPYGEFLRGRSDAYNECAEILKDILSQYTDKI